ncbi:hypothetical protein Dsin_019735 [Dipteronia sinensis]|uniref:FAF domain-containing protein n=1 Tax=Dipteronia sinensis TaxID=43782 RepID=A0AAE0A8I7_9ROSI|nr:hypothetical protein Dsin_019735 [Dipteronia sinensis]
MAACESLQHIFENSLPEKPTLLESLSSPWNQIKPVKPIDQSSFVELFGELHFKEKSQSSPSSAPSPLPSPAPVPSSFPMLSSSSSSSSSLFGLYPQSCYGLKPNNDNKRSPFLDSFSGNMKVNYSSCHNKSDSFSSMNSESLQLCTEGLGSESFDDVEDLKSEDWQNHEKKASITSHSATDNLCGDFRRSKTLGSAFPPPISCIGKTGKPWVCFKSYRHDGRFVLKEVRMPSQELLQACREGGRLKLQFVHPNDGIQDEDYEDEDYEEDEELEGVEEDEKGENEETQDVADELGCN